MRLRHIPLFLVGDRNAILAIAGSRWALLIGFLFVMSASLARNYDGADLLPPSPEWKVLTHGLGASVGNSLLLFLIVYLAASIRGAKRADGTLPAFGGAFLVFIGLFWMTAPMGWLYGIPFERMYDAPVDAIIANLWLLALVSVWRVVLITRVLAVLWNSRFVPLLLVVLLFSDIVVFVAAYSMPTPLIDFMGGLQHSQEDQLVVEITLQVIILTVLAFPVLLIAAPIGLKWFVPRWWEANEGVAGADVGESGEVGPPYACIAVAIAAVMLWFIPMGITQAEQRNRRQAEVMLRGGEVGQAIAFMSELERSDFPPVWDPPPRLGYGERIPRIEVIARLIHEPEVAGWVMAMYLPKVERSLKKRPFYGTYPTFQDAVEEARRLLNDQSPDETMIEHLLQREPGLRVLLARGRELPVAERRAVEELLEIIERLTERDEGER